MIQGFFEKKDGMFISMIYPQKALSVTSNDQIRRSYDDYIKKFSEEQRSGLRDKLRAAAGATGGAGQRPGEGEEEEKKLINAKPEGSKLQVEQQLIRLEGEVRIRDTRIECEKAFMRIDQRKTEPKTIEVKMSLIVNETLQLVLTFDFKDVSVFTILPSGSSGNDGSEEQSEKGEKEVLRITAEKFTCRRLVTERLEKGVEEWRESRLEDISETLANGKETGISLEVCCVPDIKGRFLSDRHDILGKLQAVASVVRVREEPYKRPQQDPCKYREPEIVTNAKRSDLSAPRTANPALPQQKPDGSALQAKASNEEKVFEDSFGSVDLGTWKQYEMTEIASNSIVC